MTCSNMSRVKSKPRRKPEQTSRGENRADKPELKTEQPGWMGFFFFY